MLSTSPEYVGNGPLNSSIEMQHCFYHPQNIENRSSPRQISYSSIVTTSSSQQARQIQNSSQFSSNSQTSSPPLPPSPQSQHYLRMSNYAGNGVQAGGRGGELHSPLNTPGSPQQRSHNSSYNSRGSGYDNDNDSNSEKEFYYSSSDHSSSSNLSSPRKPKVSRIKLGKLSHNQVDEIMGPDKTCYKTIVQSPRSAFSEPSNPRYKRSSSISSVSGASSTSGDELRSQL